MSEPEEPRPEPGETAETPKSGSEASPAGSPAESSASAPGPRPPSPAVLAIGFIIIALLGVIVTQMLFSNTGSPDTTESPLVKSLQADIDTANAALNRQRISMGLEPLAGLEHAESADEVARRLEEDARLLASIAKSYEDLLKKREAELDEANAQTVAALKEQQRLRDMVDAANRELREALMDASASTTLKADLERAQSTIRALQDEVDRLRAAPIDLNRQLAECRSARSLLEEELATLRARLSEASLFASSESELLKEGVALFQALRKLQNKTPSELADAYSRFGVELGANVLRTCTFETGKATVPPELEDLLVQIPREAPPGSMLFVVGYASETGNVDSNRELSSDRATAVARVLDAAKETGQKVQAAYLGQTKRFDRDVPERNQIVEIWQIVPPGLR